MIVLINPNSTDSMTQAMVKTASETVPSGAFVGLTSTKGPRAIQGRADGAAALPHMLELVRSAATRDAEAIIIGCFDDTGLEPARDIANCPVIGIGQAGYHLAALAGGRFSVVTTLPVSVPILEENIHRYGLAGQLGRVRASHVPVLDLESESETANARVIDEIIKAEQEDSINTVVLGCGGMVHIADIAKRHTNIRLIDGVRAAAILSSGFAL